MIPFCPKGMNNFDKEYFDDSKNGSKDFNAIRNLNRILETPHHMEVA